MLNYKQIRESSQTKNSIQRRRSRVNKLLQNNSKGRYQNAGYSKRAGCTIPENRTGEPDDGTEPILFAARLSGWVHPMHEIRADVLCQRPGAVAAVGRGRR